MPEVTTIPNKAIRRQAQKPTSPQEGLLWYDTKAEVLKQFKNGTFQNVGNSIDNKTIVKNSEGEIKINGVQTYFFDVSGALFEDVFIPSTHNPRSIDMVNDTTIFSVDISSQNVVKFVMSTPLDINTASKKQTLNVNEGNTFGVHLVNDGKKLYVVGNSNTRIIEYDLSTRFDLSTATKVNNFDVSGQTGQPSCVLVIDKGSKMLVGDDSTTVYEYDLSTAYDTSTASFVTSYNFSTNLGRIRDLEIDRNGSNFYLADAPGSGDPKIYQYSLGTDYDLGTRTFEKSLNVSAQVNGAQGVSFNPDGTFMAVSEDEINQYNLLNS